MTTEYTRTVLTTDDVTVFTGNETNHKLIQDYYSVIPIALMLVAGVTGNILAIVLLHKTSEKHKWRVFYRLVFVLVVFDLLGLIGQLPIMIIIYANNMQWIGGQPLCDFMAFTSIYTGMTSAMFAAAMSLDRFLAIWFPYSYNRTFSSRRANLTMIRLILNQSGAVKLNHAYDMTGARLALANQVIDPWVYILLRRDTLEPIIKAVKRCIVARRCLQHELADERSSSRNRETSTAGDATTDEEL
ncbi:prostaglandin E2 receptor EP4 subtype-like [Pecten maximus]|uniref:prostaglandin E2 receptor EP4 subtype-like n=1 Tax=Pecten maximus TaxID=6579 RepID=UPI0014589C33|nr:prostaglandin E2 receptor EP4 subtype-like [Pecten maximus]